MNKKGQVLVCFVLLLPLIIMLLAYVIDNGIIMEQKKKLDELTKTVISYSLNNRDKTQDEIKELIEKNEPNLISIDILLDEDVQIKLVKSVDAIFGRAIGLKEYKISSYYQGEIMDSKIKMLEVKK